MTDSRNLDELKDLGAGQAAPGEVSHLYQQAFREFGAAALWSSRPAPNPTVADALAITQSLRVEGDRNARRLAGRIGTGTPFQGFVKFGHLDAVSQGVALG